MADVTRKTYGQFCGLAHALDVVGERWTLLIVRELSWGPKRYSDLAETLTGIGTSLLATRMRQLEADGVVQRRLAVDQPGSVVVYELSESGRELAQAMIPLALWGARHQMSATDITDETYRAEWLLTFLASELRDVAPTGLDAVYEFHIGDSTACLHLRSGRVRVTPGPCPTPADATIRASAPTIAALMGDKLTLAEVVDNGDLAVSGDKAASATLLRLIEQRLGIEKSVDA